MQEYSRFILGKNLVILGRNLENDFTVARNFMKRFIEPSYENTVVTATVEIFDTKDDAKAYYVKLIGAIVADA